MRKYLHLFPLLCCPLPLFAFLPFVPSSSYKHKQKVNVPSSLTKLFLTSSVADPGSWFGSWISDSVSRIQSNNNNKRGGEKSKFCFTFFCSHKFHKIENWYIFEQVQKKMLSNWQRIILLFSQKIVTKLAEIWIWTGSESATLLTTSDDFFLISLVLMLI